jgi:hypothetical protein
MATLPAECARVNLKAPYYEWGNLSLLCYYCLVPENTENKLLRVGIKYYIQFFFIILCQLIKGTFIYLLKI